MTQRLEEVAARIEGVGQLRSVVNAMKGIAAARANTARDQIDAVEAYAETIFGAIAAVLPSQMGGPSVPKAASGPPAILVFLAEQGFAGAFSDHVLNSLPKDLEHAHALLVVGTRGLAAAQARDLKPVWSAPMPSHTPGVPKLADTITQEVYRAVVARRFDHLDVVYARWSAGQTEIVRQSLFPVDLGIFAQGSLGAQEAQGVQGIQAEGRAQVQAAPLTQLPQDVLIEALAAEYLHAQITRAALHAFAAENEARLAAMSQAAHQISTDMATLNATLRRVRQEAITAEIIELGIGTKAGRP